MSIRLLAFITLLLPSMVLFAQDDDQPLPDNDRIRAQKAAYIAQRLQFTTQEAAHFSAVTNDFENQRRAITARFRENMPLPASEAEADRLIQERLGVEEDLLDLKRRYYARLRERIPASKLINMPQAEREFRRDLLRQLRQHRTGGRG